MLIFPSPPPFAFLGLGSHITPYIIIYRGALVFTSAAHELVYLQHQPEGSKQGILHLKVALKLKLGAAEEQQEQDTV